MGLWAGLGFLQVGLLLGTGARGREVAERLELATGCGCRLVRRAERGPGRARLGTGLW